MPIEKKAKKYITSLRMNKLRGRMLRMPAPSRTKNKEILLVYGHHASLERMYGFAEFLNRYGAVTMPDLPGFGGMQSFFKIGKEPSLDNYADYLASFIKLQYKRRRVTIISYSFSFLVVTRMLQKYPDLSKKVDTVYSFVGFLHKDDFKFNFWQYWGLRTLAYIFRKRLPSLFMKYFMFRKTPVTLVYQLVRKKHPKLMKFSELEIKALIDFESQLWKINDPRTRMYTISEMLKVDLCNYKVDLPVVHLSVKNDRYLDHKIVDQHMKIVYSDYQEYTAKLTNHAPTIMADSKEVAKIVPLKVKRALGKK